MSRRSAVATDTGTTAVTLARAEAGLGSLPAQPDQPAHSKRMSPNKQVAEAVVIRRTFSARRCDEFDIVCNRASSMPKVWTLESQLEFRMIRPLIKRNHSRRLSAELILSPNKRSTCDIYKKLPSWTHFFALATLAQPRRSHLQLSPGKRCAGVSPPSRVYC